MTKRFKLWVVIFALSFLLHFIVGWSQGRAFAWLFIVALAFILITILVGLNVIGKANMTAPKEISKKSFLFLLLFIVAGAFFFFTSWALSRFIPVSLFIILQVLTLLASLIKIKNQAETTNTENN